LVILLGRADFDREVATLDIAISRKPWRIAASVLGVSAPPLLRKPMVVTLPACCAQVTRGQAATPPIREMKSRRLTDFPRTG